MKIKIAYLGWYTPNEQEKHVNSWLEDNPDVMVQGIEHKMHEWNILTVITYVEGALGEQQQQQPDGTAEPEDVG